MELKCSVCGSSDTFRYCVECHQYLCAEHLCIHLETSYSVVSEDCEPETGQHWLSNQLMLSSLTTKQLESAKQRYKTLLLQIEMELHGRSNGTKRHTRILHQPLSRNGVPTQPETAGDSLSSSLAKDARQTRRKGLALGKLAALKLEPATLIRLVEEALKQKLKEE